MEVLDDYRAQVFKVVANLQDKESKSFLAFARYVILSQDEFHHLERVKGKLQKEYKKANKDPRLRKGVDVDLNKIHMNKDLKKVMKPKKHVSDEEVKRWEDGLSRAFKGYLPALSRENERDAWRHISKVVDEMLAKYDSSVEDDGILLTSDAKKLGGQLLSYNNRNCIMYRRSEKEVLVFL